jgi:methyl-accepting chemotaxis protein
MSWFVNLKIRAKLLIGFLFLVCLLIFIGVYAIGKINGLAESGMGAFRNCSKPLGNLALMTRDLYIMRIVYRDMRTIMPKELIKFNEDRFLSRQKSLMEYEKQYVEGIYDDEEREIYNTYITKREIYSKYLIDTAFSLKYTGNEDKYMYDFARIAGIGAECTEIELQRLVDYNEKLASEISESNYKTANFTIILMIIIITICAVVSIVLAFYIAGLISVPVRLIEQKIEEIADTGDLRGVVEVNSEDEIGKMNDSLKKMIVNFSILIRKVMSGINSVTEESEELSFISNTAASASLELKGQTQTAASSSEQISANVSTVASSVEELSASIKEISKNTTSATALTKESEKRAHEADEVVNRLGQSSLEIGNIVKSITDIAEQTNLLALNATIEAARAGELGKGFAVVANEVKDLAKESAKATEDITKKIKAIQDDTNNAIDVIRGIIDNAVKINEVTNSIASAVEEQAVTANEVNRNIGEATDGVSSIVEIITNIKGSVDKYADQANKVKNTSFSLKDLAISIDKEIKKSFKI